MLTAVAVALWCYAAVALAYWLLNIRAMVRMIRSVPALEDLRPLTPAHWPKLSVVVPACDEAADLADAVQTLLADDYPDLEVVLVDDRSTDGTAAIVDRFAAADPRVRAVHVTDLPDGWLGKVHALDRGLHAGSGAFVLFTDADVHFARGTLRTAVAYCLDNGLDHLAAFPGLRPSRFIMRAALGAFIRQFVLNVRPWAAGNPDSNAVLGVVAFNLVRRSALEATEGFLFLRMEVADDYGLGWLMKRSGAKAAAVSAIRSVRLHWYRSIGEAAVGSEKAYATAGNCRLSRMVGLAAIMLALELSPILTVLPLAWAGGRPAGYAGLGVLACFFASAMLFARWVGEAPAAALAQPLTAPILAALFLRAGILGRRRGGVVWRGRLYPPDALRAGRRIRFP